MTDSQIVNKKLVNWFLNGETGLSSKFIVRYLTTGTSHDVRHPLDPSDLRRCHLLLKQVPELQVAFYEKMPQASKHWAALVTNWPILTATLEREMKQAGNSAPRTYEMMTALLDIP